LFVGRNDGRLTALDSSTGKQLWEFQTGAGMHAPASTFEYKGKQYVLAFSAGSALIGSARGDSVWLFGLDGTLAPVQQGQSVSRTSAAAARPAEVTAAAGATASAPPADLGQGKRLFAQACVICHGEDGNGGHGGGAPLTGLTDLAATIQTVTDGRNNMPPFSSSLTPQEVRDVSAYVVQALSGRIP
jgi:mono/diheme cytochrome c family protein